MKSLKTKNCIMYIWLILATRQAALLRKNVTDKTPLYWPRMKPASLSEIGWLASFARNDYDNFFLHDCQIWNIMKKYVWDIEILQELQAKN